MRRKGTILATLVGMLATAGAGTGPLLGEVAPAHRTRVLATADSLHGARSVPQADSLLSAELKIAEEAGDEAYSLELLVRHGRLMTSFGRSARAIPILEEAMGLAEALRDSLNLARSTRWLSLARGLQGQRAEAGELYEKLLAVATARGDSLHEGWARVGLGWQALEQGYLEEARGHYERAVALFVGIGDFDAEIWARNGYAIVLQRQGDYPAALDLYQDLTAAAQRTGYTIVEAMACNNTGSLLHKLGDPGAAVPHYERARELQLSIQQPREAIIPALNIAVCLIEQDQPEEAATLLGDLEQICIEHGFFDLRADVLYELARVRGAQNRLSEAIALHRTIMAIPEELPVGSRVRNLTGLARILAEMDSVEAALEVVEAGRAKWLERTAGNERLMLDQAWGERLADAGREDEALEVLDGLARVAASTGVTGYRISSRTRGGQIHFAADRPDSALAWLRSAAAAWEAERSVPLDPRWREQRGTFGQLIYPRLAELLLRSGAQPSEVYAAIHSFKARTLLESMLGPGKQGEIERPGTAFPTDILGAVQTECLEPGELFLDFYLGPTGSFVFAATAEEAKVARLPALGDLEEPLRNYREALAGGGATGVGGRMGILLLSEVGDLVAGSSAITWAPDGPLHWIPLSSLVVSGQELGETHKISRVPSATALLLLRKAAHGPAERVRILAVAGTRGPGGEPLNGPVREVRGLEASFRGVRSLVDPAPLEAVAAEPGEVLHIAAHAEVDARHPWRSAFLLSDRLAAATIARQRIPARMAVLSSCESVGSRALVGEGQLGLSSAFLGAGVPTVIATLWPVSDRSAFAFSELFYDALATGATVMEALRVARMEMRHSLDPALRDARAAFVLVGDGDQRFELERRPGHLRWLAWIGVAVILVIGGVRWRKALRES
jgi:tetratricopeptide (TPR) repeat protein